MARAPEKSSERFGYASCHPSPESALGRAATTPASRSTGQRALSTSPWRSATLTHLRPECLQRRRCLRKAGFSVPSCVKLSFLSRSRSRGCHHHSSSERKDVHLGEFLHPLACHYRARFRYVQSVRLLLRALADGVAAGAACAESGRRSGHRRP